MNQLTVRLARTDIGDLWLARSLRGVGRLVRILDHRQTDRGFRNELDSMAKGLRRSGAPSVLAVTDHNRQGEHYFVEYRMDAPCRSLGDHFKHADWVDRLRVVREIGRLREKWRKSLPPPLGIHGGRIVVVRFAGLWRPHLAPCPRPQAENPGDYQNVNPEILAAIPPERFRGMSAPAVTVAEDIYSIGVLTLQALGYQESASQSWEERIERQARAALLRRESTSADIEAAPTEISPIQAMFQKILQIAHRHAEFTPAARPTDASELLALCDELLQLDNPIDLAKRLRDDGHPQDALHLLSWWFRRGRHDPEAHLLAAELCREVKRPREELRNLERALPQVQANPALARRRMDLLYEFYMDREPQAGESDVTGELILQLLDELKALEPVELDMDERATAKEDRFRAAMIHLRQNDHRRRAEVLYEAAQLEWSDINTLFLYGLSLRALADVEETTDKVEEALKTLCREAEHRLERLKDAEVLDKEDVTGWSLRFRELQRQ